MNVEHLIVCVQNDQLRGRQAADEVPRGPSGRKLLQNTGWGHGVVQDGLTEIKRVSHMCSAGHRDRRAACMPFQGRHIQTADSIANGVTPDTTIDGRGEVCVQKQSAHDFIETTDSPLTDSIGKTGIWGGVLYLYATTLALQTDQRPTTFPIHADRK